MRRAHAHRPNDSVIRDGRCPTADADELGCELGLTDEDGSDGRRRHRIEHDEQELEQPGQSLHTIASEARDAGDPTSIALNPRRKR
jgi:hypothetical protein